MISASRLNAWLFRVPARAVGLELRSDGISGVVALCTFTREECAQVGNLGEVITEACQDHANAANTRVSLSVVWVDPQGTTLASKPIRAQPRPDDEDDDDDQDDLRPALAGAGRAPREEANAQGIVAQLMRHVENRERMLNIALSTNLSTMHNQLREARAEADQLRNELRNERARSRELERVSGDEQVSDAESEARIAAIEKVSDAVVQHIVPLLGARIRAGMQ